MNLYSFWKYDIFPYCLWGKVEKFKGDLVYIDSYQGWFKPFLILEGEVGHKKMEELASLRGARREADKRTQAEFRAKLNKIIDIPA